MHWQRRFLGTGRGELKINEVVAALVRDLAVPVSKVVKRVEAHHQASLTSNLKRFRGASSRASRRPNSSCSRGDLPPACSMSFFTDTTGVLLVVSFLRTDS